MNTRSLNAALLMIGAAFFWSVQAPLLRICQWDPVATVLVRMAGGGVLMAAIFMARRNLALGEHRLRQLAVALFSASASMLWTFAPHYTSVARIAALSGICPLLTVILSSLETRRLPQRRHLVCAVGVLAGVLLMTKELFDGKGSWIGDVLALGAGFSWAASLTVQRKLNSKEISAATVAGFFGASLVLVPWTCARLPLPSPSTTQLVLLVVIVIPGALAYVCFAYASPRLAPATSGILIGLEHPIGVFLGVILFRERPDLLSWCGIILICVMVFIVAAKEGDDSANAT